MEISINKISDCQVSLSATVPASDVAAAKDSILAAYSKSVRLPGFRPGKAPKSVIAKRYAADVNEELEMRLKSDIQDKCLEQNPDLKVLDFGTPEGTIAEDGSYTLTATLTVVPEFELPEYTGKNWKEVKLVTLEEKDLAPLTVDENGFAEFEITGKKILTIKFVG